MYIYSSLEIYINIIYQIYIITVCWRNYIYILNSLPQDFSSHFMVLGAVSLWNHIGDPVSDDVGLADFKSRANFFLMAYRLVAPLLYSTIFPFFSFYGLVFCGARRLPWLGSSDWLGVNHSLSLNCINIFLISLNNYYYNNNNNKIHPMSATHFIVLSILKTSLDIDFLHQFYFILWRLVQAY